MKSALSAACTSASGILEMIEGDTQMMPFNAGKAASNAVVSALTGYSGFKVPVDALGGKRGFLNCFADKTDFNLLTDFSGKVFCTTNYFKPYAACGHCHAGIEASLRLKAKGLFDVKDIESVEVKTYKLALKGHDHTLIDGVNSARMSIPFAVSSALMKGSADIDDFGIEAVNNQDLLELTAKVHVSECEELTKQAPAKRMAIVTVLTPDHSFSETVDYPKGQPENPMSLDDISEKYFKCGHYSGISESTLESVLDMIFTGKGRRVSDMMPLLS